MISPGSRYIGIGAFYTSTATYANTTCAEFSSGKGSDSLSFTYGECIQKLEVPASDVTVMDDSVQSVMSYGDTQTLQLKIRYSNRKGFTLQEPVSWSSSDTDVVSVSGNTATAVGYGTATLTAVVNGLSYTFSVTVDDNVTVTTTEPNELEDTMCLKFADLEMSLEELQALQNALGEAGRGIRLDLSMADEMEYYNGLVFTGYVAGIPCAVLKGGRYDYLMQRFTPGANAIGFAIYLDELERLAAPLPPVQQQGREKSWLNIALPKGRLGDKAYKLLAGAGYSATEDYNDTRRLVVENPDACVRYFLVKPSDVAIYVEHGAADIGIVGKDILTESGADVYELLDTGMGKCRMCVAGPAGFTDDESRALRVATKFVNIARDHYERRGRDIDIVKLNGSIELAPILGLSDVIVDIVETGTTLKENDLTVIEEFMPISARFIANKASYKFKYAQLTELLNKMKEALAK